MFAVALAAAALLVVVALVLATLVLDLIADRDLLSAFVAGCRQREADAVRRAERAERRAAAAEAQVASLHSFDEEPSRVPMRRVA